MTVSQNISPLEQYRPLPGVNDLKIDGLEFWISVEAQDPGWDLFLAQTPGGHYRQSSLWAQFKANAGWQAIRLIVTREQMIVSGAQILTRSLPIFGKLGYTSKGPLIKSGEVQLSRIVIEALHQVARLDDIAYLIVQPPENALTFEYQLPARGFRSSPKVRMPTTTTRIDLSHELNHLQSNLRKSTWANIRRGQSRGIVVREGTNDDLEIFYSLLQEASKRKQFEILSRKYFSNLWQLFGPGEHIQLFIAEYDGEPVSALFTIAFGDTLFTHTSAWSGRHKDRKPNELMEWTAILWAKNHGYRFYDFEGIEPETAHSFLQDQPIADPQNHPSDIWVTHYKLGFGGQVLTIPGTYDYVYNPLLRWTYHHALPKVEHWPVVSKMVKTVVRTTQPQLS